MEDGSEHEQSKCSKCNTAQSAKISEVLVKKGGKLFCPTCLENRTPEELSITEASNSEEKETSSDNSTSNISAQPESVTGATVSGSSAVGGKSRTFRMVPIVGVPPIASKTVVGRLIRVPEELSTKSLSLPTQEGINFDSVNLAEEQGESIVCSQHSIRCDDRSPEELKSISSGLARAPATVCSSMLSLHESRPSSSMSAISTTANPPGNSTTSDLSENTSPTGEEDSIESTPLFDEAPTPLSDKESDSQFSGDASPTEPAPAGVPEKE